MSVVLIGLIYCYDGFDLLLDVVFCMGWFYYLWDVEFGESEVDFFRCCVCEFDVLIIVVDFEMVGVFIGELVMGVGGVILFLDGYWVEI